MQFLLKTKLKLKKKFLHTKKKKKVFECLKDNVLRSIATYYTSEVRGKRKYKAIRLASSMKSSNMRYVQN